MPRDDMPTHDEIEAMRGGGFVPDPVVDAIHRERDRFDEAHARMLRLLSRPLPDGPITIPVISPGVGTDPVTQAEEEA